MNSLTKFFIALFVFVLLSFIVKAQRAVGNGTPVISGGGEVTRQELQDTSAAIRTDAVSRSELADSVASRITQAILDDSTAAIRSDFSNSGTIIIKQNIGGLYSDEFNVGDLQTKYPTATYNDLKVIRQANWTILKTLCDSSQIQNIPVLLPAGEIEIHINDGQRITVPDSAVLVIQGQETIIETWPIVKSYDIVLFDLDRDYRDVNNTLKISDCTFISEPFRLETYNATLRVSGDRTKITITDSYISAGALAKLVPGQSIVVNYSPTQIGFDHSILAYDIPSKTITLTTNLNIIIPENDAGYIGITFSEDTPVDTIRTRGEFWLEEKVSWTFCESIYGFGNNNKPVYITLDNVEIRGFDNGISLSNVSGKVKINNSYISCHSIGISAFSSNTYIRDYYIEIYNSKFIDNGFVVYAYGQGVSITADNVYGSGTYFHPNIVAIISNCLFDNIAVNFRNYSGGGATDNIVEPEWQTLISNCVFKATDDIYNVLLSEVMPVQIVNCSFEGGNVICGLKTTIINSYFYGSAVTGANWNGCFTTIRNCYLYESAIEISSDNVATTAKVFIDNVYIYPVDGTSAPTLNFGNIEYVLISNSEIAGRVLNANYALLGGIELPKKWEFRDCKIGQFTGWPYLFSLLDFYGSNYRPEIIFDRCELSTQICRCNQNSSENVIKLVECTYTALYTNTVYNPYIGTGVKLKKDINRTPQVNSLIDGIQGWSLDPNYNIFKISGLTGKRLYMAKGILNMFSDEVTIIASDSLIFTKYDPVTNNTSNVLFNANLSTNEVIKLQYDPYHFLYDGTSVSVITDTLGVVSNTTTLFQARTMGNSSHSNKIIPGTVTITAPGGQVFTDDGKGNLYQSGVYAGFVDYIRNGICIRFTTPPSTGNLIATYSWATTLHSYGAWLRL